MRLNSTVHPRDIFANPMLVVLVFWIPILAIAATGYAHVPTACGPPCGRWAA